MTDENYIILEEDGEKLTGLYHLCPLCFSTLSYRPLPDYQEKHWYCKSCKTEWEVGDLLEAYRQLLSTAIPVEVIDGD